MTLKSTNLMTRVFSAPVPRVGTIQYLTNAANVGTMDAANEGIAFLGKLRILDGSASKTFSSAGGKIHFLCGASTTFANAGTTMRVGVQDTTQASGSVSPDNTFDVYDDLVGGTDTLTSSAINTATMSSGSKSISNGAKLAVVFLLTARGGTDSVKIAGFGSSLVYQSFPGTKGTTDASAWSVVSGVLSATSMPVCLIEFDDGTFGVFEHAFWAPAADTTTSVTSASNPDEYGMRFTVPFRCKLVGVEFPVKPSTGALSGTAGVLRLSSGAAASPSLVTSEDIDGYEIQANSGSSIMSCLLFSTPQILVPGTTYYLTFRANTTMTWVFHRLVYPAAGQLAALPFGTNAYQVSRDASTDGTGAFTEDTASIVPVTLMLSQLDDGFGTGRPSLAIGV